MLGARHARLWRGASSRSFELTAEQKNFIIISISGQARSRPGASSDHKAAVSKISYLLSLDTHMSLF